MITDKQALKTPTCRRAINEESFVWCGNQANDSMCMFGLEFQWIDENYLEYPLFKQKLEKKKIVPNHKQPQLTYLQNTTTSKGHNASHGVHVEETKLITRGTMTKLVHIQGRLNISY